MTLNNIKNELFNFFDGHPLIQGVNVTVDDSDFNAINGALYPVVNIQYIDSDILTSRFQHNFKIIIGDLTNPNVDGIDYEIFSDCLQISGDFFWWLESNYLFDYVRTTSIQPFTDSNVDRVSGVVFTIGIITPLTGDINCD